MIYTKAEAFSEVLQTAKHFAKKYNEEYFIICGPLVDYCSAFYPYGIYNAEDYDREFVDTWMVEALVYPNGDVESWR